MAEKVTVKIAVSIDEHGDWCAAGWPGEFYENKKDHDLDMVCASKEFISEGNLKIYFIEAEIDAPEKKLIETIKCEAVEVGE